MQDDLETRMRQIRERMEQMDSDLTVLSKQVTHQGQHLDRMYRSIPTRKDKAA